MELSSKDSASLTVLDNYDADSDSDSQHHPKPAARHSYDTPRDLQSSSARQIPTKVGPGLLFTSASLTLSPLSLRLANIGFPKLEECAKLIEQHALDEFNGYNDFLQEALSAYISGDVDYCRSCVQASLLLRERASTSPNQTSQLFDGLFSNREGVLSDVLKDIERIFEFVKAQASDKKAAAMVAPSEFDTGLTSQGTSHDTSRAPAHGLQKMPARSIGPGEDARPLQHLGLTIEQRLYTGAPRPHAEYARQSQPGPIQAQSRNSDSSVQADEIGIRGLPNEIETLDPRYQLQRHPSEFFVVGKVFALLWHESLGIRSTTRYRHPQDSYTSKDRFGEQVFSHISRMVVVRRGYGYSWCVAINTYGGRGLAKRGLTTQLRNAHAIIYDTARSPYKAPGEPESPSRPIAVILSPDQQLDKMSRLDFSKVHTVEWDVKVMNIGRVTDDSLQYLQDQWAKETVRSHDEATVERPSHNSSMTRDPFHLTSPSLPTTSGRDLASSDENSSRSFREPPHSVGHASPSSLPRQTLGFARTSGDIRLHADSGYRSSLSAQSGRDINPSSLSHLSQLFAQIKITAFDECKTFIENRPGVLREDANQFLREAALAHRRHENHYARACVHRGLLIRKCSRMDHDECVRFLHNLATGRKSTVGGFLEDLDDSFEAMKSRADKLVLLEAPSFTPVVSPGYDRHAVQDPQLPVTTQPSPYLRGPTDTLGPLPSFGDLQIGQIPAYRFPSNPFVTQTREERPGDALAARNSLDSRSTGGSRDSTQSDIEIRGTEGEAEHLDPRYRRQTDPGGFFVVGKVFEVLWHENMGRTNEKPKPGSDVGFISTIQTDNSTIGRYGERIFSHIRRMVVVRRRYGYCWCVVINTYGGKGVGGKRRADDADRSHAIVYDSTKQPQYVSDEKEIVKEPIAIIMTPPQTLNAASRLNYAKVQTVEHNVKVLDVGMVHPKSMAFFKSHWENEVSKK